jgi:F-type H+-transporting ATPase subunit b
MAADNSADASSGGMPQLDFSTFPNQAFWLIVTMVCLFMIVRLLIIPRMDNILANRRKVIEEDLVGAEKFREAAEELSRSITEEIDQAKLRSADIIGKSKEKIKLNRQAGLIEAKEMTEKLLFDSNKSIQKMQTEANKQIEKISSELAPEIVTKMSMEK